MNPTILKRECLLPGEYVPCETSKEWFRRGTLKLLFLVIVAPSAFHLWEMFL